ncbi:MAG TPA: asparaginase [Planctomycetota bacterium]|nr:asparaginase [Planctomycetota bacterium]
MPHPELQISASPAVFPDNPVLVRIWRGDWVESQHRGSWALVDGNGKVLESAGDVRARVFARSSLKSIQALPLLESGAAERFGLGEVEVALAVSSHSGEPCHTEPVARLLARLGLGVEALQCGPQPPNDSQTRAELERRGEKPSSLHNNCSGKHAGFLCLACHLGLAPERYLDPQAEVQTLVHAAVEAMTGVLPGELSTAIDGCSAPTFRMPLGRLATAIARVSNPERLPAKRRAACERVLEAAAHHPELIAGHHRRLCTDLSRATKGRLFPKIGGEAVYVVGIRGADRGLAVKIDDGETRGLHPLVIALCERFGFLGSEELRALHAWRAGKLRNWAGIEVGRVEVVG